MKDMNFVILEQHDGRYIVVREKTSVSYDKEETIVAWEEDCRNRAKCYSAVSEWMVSTGEIMEYAARITYRRYKGEE